MASVLETAKVPAFVPKTKTIVTDESVSKAEAEGGESMEVDVDHVVQKLQKSQCKVYYCPLQYVCVVDSS